VYHCPFPKRRLGRRHDGGYIVADVEHNFLMSAGIGDDLSFEHDFLLCYPNAKCVAHDGTISQLPYSLSPERFTFVPKNVGVTNSAVETNMKDLLSNTKICLKMDIEGAEIPWFESLSEEQMNNLDQMIIEFHWPFSARETQVFKKLNTTHVLIHIHGNNHAGARLIDTCVVPDVFECTYLHKRFVPTLIVNRDALPSVLDSPNAHSKPDIDLNHWPFVQK
jgi:hypothetical protein